MACNCGSTSFLHLSNCVAVEKQSGNVYNVISDHLKQGKRVVYGIDYYRSFRPIMDVLKRTFKSDYLMSSETFTGGALYLRNGGYIVLVRRDQANQVRGMTFDVAFIDQCDDFETLKEAILPTTLVADGSLYRVDSDHQVL